MSIHLATSFIAGSFALLSILGVSTIIVPVTAQEVGTTVDFSLSGGGSISHTFNVTNGTQPKVTYSLTTSNSSACVEVTGSVEQVDKIPINVTLYNLTFPPAKFNSSYSYTFPKAGANETVSMSYSMCTTVPACQDKVKVSAKYDADVQVSVPSIPTLLQIVAGALTTTALAGVAGAGIVGITLVYRWLSGRWPWRKGAGTVVLAPSHPS